MRTSYQKWYREHNREKLKHTRFKSRIKALYGLTPERLEDMQKAQNFSCVICLRKLPLVVDHDHVTGKVRGLLCRGCNISLGGFQDSLTVLESAKSYLQKHEQPN